MSFSGELPVLEVVNMFLSWLPSIEPGAYALLNLRLDSLMDVGLYG